MKSKVIIGIHGLGNKPPKEILEKWWSESLTEGLKIAGYTENLPVFKLVYWADILYEHPLDETIQDVNQPLYLDEKYIPSSGIVAIEYKKYRKKIVDFVKKSLDKVFLKNDFTVNHSSISNAIIRRFFSDLESYYTGNFQQDNSAQKVRAIIRERLATELRKYDGNEIMLIAHSMGSIVAFDVLTLMVPDIAIDTFVTIGSPLGLPVVKSNIAIENNLCANGRTTLPVPPGIVRNWYNFADIEDVVALHYDIHDDYQMNANGANVIDVLITNDYFCDRERRPHNAFGYLRTHELSKILYEFVSMKEKSRTEKLVEILNNLFQQVKTIIKPV